MINDLRRCNIGEDLVIVDEWSRAHPNIFSTAKTIFGNLFNHGFGMTSHAMNAIIDLQDKNWYKFGHECGWIMGRILETKI